MSAPAFDRSLRHPYERSRLAIALLAIAVVIAFVLFIVDRAGGLVAALAALGAGVLFLVLVGFAIWLGLQLHRARLLGHAVRVGPDAFPQIHEMVAALKRDLDYRRTVEVYVTATAQPPATMLSIFGTRIILLEGDLAADVLSPQRRAHLAFLLGRFIGALKARHDRMTLVAIGISLVENLKFLNLFMNPYERAITYSGDQIALAYCGDLPAALGVTSRLLVGKDLAPELAAEAVVDQAETVQSAVLPRLAQFVSPVPHLTNRYVNLLAFARGRVPGFDEFRAHLDDAAGRRLDALIAASPHASRRPRPSPAAGAGARPGHAPPAAGSGRARVALAAIGTVVVAAAVVGVLIGARSGDTPGNGPSGTTPDPLPSLTQEEELLLAEIPSEVGATCESADPSPGALASLVCVQNDQLTLWYDRFPSVDALDAFFSDQAAESGSPEGSCQEKQSAWGPWNSGGVVRGDLLCYPAPDGSAWLLWTHRDRLIAVYASRSDGGYQKLIHYWSHETTLTADGP